ncbi:hypothetical protein CR513_18015, partial [Mucuna pruriens]
MGIRSNYSTEVQHQKLENQLIELTSLVRHLAIGQLLLSMAARVYGICTSVEHPTNMCPTLQETKSDHFESVGSIVVPAKYESRAIPSSKIRTRLKHASQSKVPPQGNSPPLEDLMKQLATSNLEFQQIMNSNNMQFQQKLNATI